MASSCRCFMFKELLATHRSLSRDGVLEATEYTSRPGYLELQKPKRELKLFLFSDIFVFMDGSEMKKKGKKEYTVWPNELIWVSNNADTPASLLEIIGPWKRIILNCVSPDVLELWKQAFIQSIEGRLRSEPSSLGAFIPMSLLICRGSICRRNCRELGCWPLWNFRVF